MSAFARRVAPLALSLLTILVAHAVEAQRDRRAPGDMRGAMRAERAPAEARRPQRVPRATRAIRIDATETGVVMSIAIEYGAEEMLRVARIADEDQDGEVSAREARRYMEDWADVLRRELPLRVDGSFVRVPWARHTFEPLGRIGVRPGRLSLRAEVSLVPGERMLFVTDQTRVDAFDRTQVSFGQRAGGKLLRAGPSDTPTGLVYEFTYGPGEALRRVHNFGLSVELPPPEISEMPFVRPAGLKLPLVLLPSISLFAVAFARLMREAKARRRR